MHAYCPLVLFLVVENVVIAYSLLGLDLCKFKVKRKKKLFETKLFRISISTSSHIGSAWLVLMVSAFKMTYFFHNVVT